MIFLQIYLSTRVLAPNHASRVSTKRSGNLFFPEACRIFAGCRQGTEAKEDHRINRPIHRQKHVYFITNNSTNALVSVDDVAMNIHLPGPRTAATVQCSAPGWNATSRRHSLSEGHVPSTLYHMIGFNARKGCFVARERSVGNIRCMANPRRMARVSKQIEREIGVLFVSDKVVQAAVCPERKRGIDDALSALASVTEVEISNDLQVAKVYLSIYSDESGKAVAMRGLKSIEGYVRKHIGRKIRLRLTPEIRFILDDSIERSERVLSLLKQVERINAGDVPPPPVTIAEDYGDEDEFDVFYEDGDGDQGVIASVDLGFYDDDQVGPTPPLNSPTSLSGSEKDGSISLSDDDVEEMLSFFKQDATRIQKRGKNRK